MKKFTLITGLPKTGKTTKAKELSSIYKDEEIADFFKPYTLTIMMSKGSLSDKELAIMDEISTLKEVLKLHNYITKSNKKEKLPFPKPYPQNFIFILQKELNKSQISKFEKLGFDVIQCTKSEVTA